MSTVFAAKAPAVTTYDLLKYMAVLLMVIDHIGLYFFPDQAWLRVLGRGAAPIWFFLVGFSGKTSVDWRLWLGAAVMLLADLWLLPPPVLPVNILVTIILIRYVLALIPNPLTLQLWVAGLVVSILALPFTYPYIEYGALGLMLALWGVAVRQQQTANWQPAIFALGMFAYFQVKGFGFDWAHAACMIGVLAAVFVLLRRFQPVPLAVPPVVAWGLWVGGRHSLIIYVAHLLLFAATARYMLHLY